MTPYNIPEELLNHITVGDAAELLKLLPDECVDLTVTSPPYDNLRSYNGYAFDFEAIATQLYRVTKQGGVVVWIVGDETKHRTESCTSFEQVLYFRRKLGFNLHDTMIYQTDKPPLNDNRYQSAFEFMFVLSKVEVKTFNPIMDKSVKYGTRSTNYSGHRGTDGEFKKRSGGKYIQNEEKIRINIWKYYVGQGRDDEIAYQHPARFPEDLAKDHILSWSNAGDVVLDPMCGSGTVPKMCVLTDRNFIGFDISEEYCLDAIKRIEVVLKQPKLFPYEAQPSYGKTGIDRLGYQQNLLPPQNETHETV